MNYVADTQSLSVDNPILNNLFSSRRIRRVRRGTEGVLGFYDEGQRSFEKREMKYGFKNG